MLLGRLFSYTDTHRYRIGTNYLQLPVNAPNVEVHSYNKDGQMRYRHNGAQPVYTPNSYGGPRADPRAHVPGWYVQGGEIMRSAYTKGRDDDDFGQAGTLYRKVLDDAARARLAHNIVDHLKAGVEPRILRAAVEYWKQVDANLGLARPPRSDASYSATRFSACKRGRRPLARARARSGKLVGFGIDRNP